MDTNGKNGHSLSGTYLYERACLEVFTYFLDVYISNRKLMNWVSFRTVSGGDRDKYNMHMMLREQELVDMLNSNNIRMLRRVSSRLQLNIGRLFTEENDEDETPYERLMQYMQVHRHRLIETLKKEYDVAAEVTQ